MYLLLVALFLLIGAGLLAHGSKTRRLSLLVSGAAVIALPLLFFPFLAFWGEVLWFRSLGYESRLWTEVLARVGLAAGGAVAGGGLAFALTRGLSRRKAARFGPAGLAAAVGAAWGFIAWDELLRCLHGVTTGVEDPILGRDTGFYLFTLPFLDAILGLALLTTLVSVVTWGFAVFSARASEAGRAATSRIVRSGIPALLVLATVLAAGKVLDVFHLMYSRWGVTHGPGWTDVHVRLPALVVIAVATLGIASVGLASPVRRRVEAMFPARRSPGGEDGAAAGTGAGNGAEGADDAGDGRVFRRELFALGAPWVAIFALWFAGLWVVPGLVHWLRVQPNEISLEMPYIAHNIEFTRRGFGLDRVEVREFPASEMLTRETLDANRKTLDEVRLWDWRALVDVYKQFQEIRLYYEFDGVDIDRYSIGDRYRQVMVSAREMQVENLPARSRTFVNRRFKYTHGYGLTLAPVSDFTEEGLPNLLVKGIPPRSEHPDLEVEQPRLYYGELTDQHVVANSREKEFDYPKGDANAYYRYDGSGGVEIDGLFRKFLFGWKFDGTRLLFSGYPKDSSRILFHRSIHDRVSRVAPFLDLDEDAYPVLVDGRIHWILDAYTTSRFYPYSEPYDAHEVIEYRRGQRTDRLEQATVSYLDGKNYVRNSVKAVVDAYDGSVDLYVFEDEDPIVRVWRSIYPGLFRDASEMPDALRAHVRYPEGLLLAQGRVYARYHMKRPDVFYNQEDLWVRATEKYHARIRPVEPYYVMWDPPGSAPKSPGAARPAEEEGGEKGERGGSRAGDPEFVMILPFTPKNRQVLIGWIAGMCDAENYGRFLAYKFPKERRVLGPQQVETKIDQDRYLSAQLSLWDQRGSRVIRGNVLAIPIDDTLIYVEPIYLQAETAAYPELRLVVAMHGERLGHGEGLSEAIEDLLDGDGESRGEEPDLSRVTESGAPGSDARLVDSSLGNLALDAESAFERYLDLQQQRRFDDAAAELDELSRLLSELAGRTLGPDDTEDADGSEEREGREGTKGLEGVED